MTKKYIFLLLLFPLFLNAQNWKAEAEQAIETHRKADVKIAVVDASGAPVSDAIVTLKMREHQFLWGTAVSISFLQELEQRGFPLGTNHPYYNHLRHFNSIGPENAGKWKFWLNNASRKKYLETMDWFNEQNIQNRGHTTIWPSITRWNAVPNFVVNAEAIVENGVIVKSKNDVIRDTIKAHFNEQLPILAAKGVYEMDLINELVHEGDIVENLMQLPVNQRPVEHAQWYKWAKAAAPDMLLTANEYDFFQSSNNFHERFVDYVQIMLANGAPVDAVGMQGHFFSNIPDWQELKKRLAEVAVLDLPMSVTEFDMNQTSYEAMERVMYAVFSEPLVKNFSIWGAWDGKQWRNNGPIYFENWEVKESGKAWFDLVKKEWWTDTTVVLNATNILETSGFLGDYDIYVEHDGKIIIQQVKLDKAGLDVKISVDETGFAKPQATLEITDNQTDFFPNEPIQLSISTTDSIESVTFFQDNVILSVVDTPPFNHEFSVTKGQNLELSATIKFKNGFRFDTQKKNINILNTNSSPSIQSVFPLSGNSVLQQSDLEVYITANDAQNDPLTACIYDENGLELACSDVAPFYIVLPELPVGFNNLTIRVEDDKFGFAERTYFLIVVTDNESNVLKASPLAENNDVEEKADGGIDLTGDLDLGEKINGIRFPIVGIPPTAEIDSAFIQFSSQKGQQEGLTKWVFQAEKSTTAAPFSNAFRNLSNRDLTDAFVKWEPPTWQEIGDKGAAQKTPDFTAILQELQDISNWTDQSPISILVNFETAPSKRSAFSVDQSAEDAPQLTVFYQAQINNVKPPAPEGFSFTKITETLGTVSWETPVLSNEIWGYKLRIDGEEIREVLTNSAYSLSNLDTGKTYIVEAQTIGKLSILSDWSEPFSFTLNDQSVSTNEPPFLQDLTIFPNPVTDFVTIKNTGNTPIRSIALLTIEGKVLEKINYINNQQIDLTNLLSGTYLLKVTDHEGLSGYFKLFKK